ncbi:tetratricopeptide (TPR) repeat protein [Nocardiopsis terrae]|uniref:Tetratricopeptide (TPR) repeat protein n=1 Tax=Nocardiopsis terrae TaxID=372655 RepID=A0ABR9HDN4_9ACTN|nr:CHAT domain-containing protein [Nocardiopsis terrae]MBE1457144.1 tetratricopeptide (TPR) repeat protein [Nocardiopsis terrae]
MLPSAAPDPTPANTLPDARDPSTGQILLSRVTQGVRLARNGLFEETVALLDDTRKRLHGHPIAELAPVLPGLLADLGLAQTLCGRFGQAEEHLNEARSLADARRLPLLGLVAEHNLGCLDLHRGETATAITTFHELVHRMPADRQEALRVDLAEALLSEGLVEEAGRTLAEAPWQASRGGVARTLVEAKLRLLDGDRRGSLHLTRQVRANEGPGSLWHGITARLERAALGVTDDGSPVLRAQDTLALRAPSLPRPPREPASAGPRGGGRPREGLSGAYRALSRLSRLGAPPPGPWLGSAGRDPHVVRAGLESALATGDAATALEWAELGRTWAVGLVPGPGTVGGTALRELTGRYRRALCRGGGPEAGAYARRWEAARWRALHPGRRNRWAKPRGPVPGPVLEQLLDALEGRAFIHYTAAGGDAVALLAVDGRVHARYLGPLLGVRRVLARFAHERSAPSTGAAAEPHHSTAAQASDALFRPLLPLIGERAVVVTGDPYLSDLPWGLLPALRGRPVRLVPTARSWAERPPERRGWERVLLACGPEPEQARLEVASLAAIHPGARLLERARRDRVLTELARSDLAHMAGHGQVGDRTPMLSRLELHDEPLLACDLASLPSTPDLVTLSSCWGGRGFVGAAGQPLGFVGALLARGTRTVVASPVPVEDARTGAAMVAFHRAITTGTDVSEAVSDHLGHVGFCCYGA